MLASASFSICAYFSSASVRKPQDESLLTRSFEGVWHQVHSSPLAETKTGFSGVPPDYSCLHLLRRGCDDPSCSRQNREHGWLPTDFFWGGPHSQTAFDFSKSDIDFVLLSWDRGWSWHLSSQGLAGSPKHSDGGQNRSLTSVECGISTYSALNWLSWLLLTLPSVFCHGPLVSPCTSRSSMIILHPLYDWRSLASSFGILQDQCWFPQKLGGNKTSHME